MNNNEYCLKHICNKNTNISGTNINIGGLRGENSCAGEIGLSYFEQITKLLNSRGNVEEFDIIPSVKLQYKSYQFVAEGNKAGFFSRCVKDMFCYTYNDLIEARKCLSVEMQNEGANLMNLSRTLLLIYPEDYTIWNLKKQYTTTIEKICKG